MAVQAAESIGLQSDGPQREPSMEEILASIRRIIEDSDQVRKPEEATLPEPGSHVADQDDQDDLKSFSDELKPQADAAMAQELSSHEQVPADEPKSHLSASADKMGLKAKAAGAQEAPGKAPFGAPPVQREAQPQDQEPAGEREDSMALDKEIDAGLSAAAAQAKPATPASASAQVHGAVALSPARENDDEKRGSIISEQAGRQVAAAFDELSEAFAASRRRSFDEIAAEMMRPMLQEWMDNNLPTLVERLVREEIERVARGHSG